MFSAESFCATPTSSTPSAFSAGSLASESRYSCSTWQGWHQDAKTLTSVTWPWRRSESTRPGLRFVEAGQRERRRGLPDQGRRQARGVAGAEPRIKNRRQPEEDDQRQYREPEAPKASDDRVRQASGATVAADVAGRSAVGGEPSLTFRPLSLRRPARLRARATSRRARDNPAGSRRSSPEWSAPRTRRPRR